MIPLKSGNKKILRGGSLFSSETDESVMLAGYLSPSLHQGLRSAGKLKRKKRRH